MLKIIASKNDSEIYSLARKEKDKAKVTSSFLDCEIDEAQTFAENVSIFGDKSAYMIKVSREDELEKISTELFDSLESSEHFFVIVGSGVDFVKRASDAGGKVQKIEEKFSYDFPAELVASIQRHDKKNSWNLLLKELNSKVPEIIHGNCVFAYKSLLVYLNDPKKNNPSSGVKDFSWKQAANNAKVGKRERGEAMDKYFNLILNYHKARNGEMDLGRQLEAWILEN